MDWGLVVSVLVFLEGLIILRGLIELGHQIEQGIDDLDKSLAGAIASVVDRFAGGEGFEPINPIQQAIATMLTNRMENQNPGVIEVVGRAADGKFTKND